MSKVQQLRDNQETVIDIMKNYSTPGGRVSWGKAFKENPDYQSILGVNLKSHADRQRLTSFVHKIKESGNKLSEGLSDESPTKKRYTRKKTNESGEFGLLHVKHCPKCGCNLEAVDVALRLTE